MTNRALTLLVVPAVFALSCHKDEPAPAVSAAPPTTAAAEPGPMAAAPPAEARAADEGPGFEGEVDLRITSAAATEAKKATPLVRLQVKGKRLRFALPEGFEGAGPQLDPKGYMVIDGRDKKMMVVSDEKRQVVLLPLDKLSQQLGKAAADKNAEKPGEPKPELKKPPEITKTGKTDTVAGRSCEEWDVVMEDKAKMRVCVASEETSWLELPTLGLPSEHAWAHELMDGEHLPLRMVAFEPSGKEKMRVELTRLEKKPLDDALFAPPAGYKVLDMGEMMKGVAAMLGGALPPGAGGQTQGALPPGMAGKMPGNFAAMMARMRGQMEAMKARQEGAPGAEPERAARTEKLAAPAEEPKAAAKASAKDTAKAKARAKAKAGVTATTEPTK